MKDGELLELAANAVGGYIKVENMGWIEDLGNDQRGNWWNPLGDDGDALRLAIQCELDIMLTTHGSTVSRPDGIFAEEYSKDAYAATRRAIVRAAAEIGKSVVTQNAGVQANRRPNHGPNKPQTNPAAVSPGTQS